MLWILSQSKAIKPRVTDEQKEVVNIFFEPLIANYKTQLQQVDNSKEGTYTIDIYSKWYQHYFYLCEKYKSENPNRIVDEYERKYLRLEFISENNFNFSYYRHTGAWHLVAENCSLETCLQMINENGNFQPLL